MVDLPYVKNFRDLLAYQKARALSLELFRQSSSFPKEEIYSLTDQVRRSSRSVGAQIAEAWALRRYERHFISKLTDADGEQHETQHWIETAADCGYIDRNRAKELLDKCTEIGRMINGMISKSDIFCGEPDKHIKEPVEEYNVDSIEKQ
jgi:four helix bundle protein